MAMPERLSQDRGVQRLSGLVREDTPRPLTIKDIQRAVSRLRSRLSFWDAVALCFMIDPAAGDVVVMPWRLIEECEREGGRHPAWLKGADIVQDAFVLRGRSAGQAPPQLVQDSPQPRPAPATCGLCGSVNLHHFFRSRQGQILCRGCFQRSPESSELSA
jgi:hypothetical protein